jgi:hypothetical protein
MWLVPLCETKGASVVVHLIYLSLALGSDVGPHPDHETLEQVVQLISCSD